MSKTLTRLAETITEMFQPWFPDGFIQVSLRKSSKGKPHLNLRIGNRDVDINTKGEAIGSGMFMKSEWKIKLTME